MPPKHPVTVKAELIDVIAKPRMKSDSTPLSKDAICREALNIIKTEGLNNLSMRNLASNLKIKAPSLYAHIQNKSNLILMVQAYAFRANDLVGSLNPEHNSLNEYMSVILQNMRHFFLNNQYLFELFASYSSNSEESRDTFERFLIKMQNFGFSLYEAAYIGRAIRVYVLGHVKFELSIDEDSKRHPQLPSDIDSRFSNNYTFFITDGGYDKDKSFEFGANLLINGCEKILAGK